MPHTTCAHCHVAITDHATMVEHGGRTFCCTNCSSAEHGQMRGRATTEMCAHCHVPLVDQTTLAERNGQTFCCVNCASAMAASVGQH
ncbi:MAG: hypothetical protein IT306_30695 [Chloroflexi bacterium]|nr:hypothetical protein [Chloroflexota bacterium]